LTVALSVDEYTGIYAVMHAVFFRFNLSCCH